MIYSKMATASLSVPEEDRGSLDLESCSLAEFIRSYNIPQTVTATKQLCYTSPSGNRVGIQPGDILLLRSVITASVTLSYFDPDTAYTRDVHLPANFPGRFVVLNVKTDTRPARAPEHEGTPGEEREHPDNPYENYVGKMYERVDDLSRDCPPFFKSTESFVDPVDNKVRFSAGDRFRTVTLITDPSGKKYLECKHMSGQLMRLPGYCKGQFQALQDKCYYTLSELISMAPVSRRLQLARDSMNGMYPIPGIKRDYIGDIHMHKPVSHVQVSPWKQLEVTWNLPSDLSLHIKHCAVEEYETPVSHFDANRYTLTQFRLAYEDSFPVQACIQTYTDKPAVFTKYIPQRSPVVCVLRYDKVEKILAKSDEQHYVLSPTLKATCVPVCRKFHCVSELLKTRPGTKVIVREDIACDAPSPFCLHSGDILSISARTTFTVVNVNYKYNNSTHQVSILKCDRISSRKSPQKVKIPLDLEVEMDEVLDGGRDKQMSFSEFIGSKPEFPITVEFGVDGSPCTPYLPRKLTLYCSIRDPCIYVSRRPRRARHKGNHGGDYDQPVLEIPERHLAMLSFERLLSVEDVTAASSNVVRCEIEPISNRLFKEMENEDRSYETIASHNLPLPKKIPYRHKLPRSRPLSMASLSALSKSLPSLTSLLHHHKKTKMATGTTEMNIQHLDTGSPEVVGQEESDENLYEDVVIDPSKTAPATSLTQLNKLNTNKEKKPQRRTLFKKKSMDV